MEGLGEYLESHQKYPWQKLGYPEETGHIDVTEITSDSSKAELSTRKLTAREVRPWLTSIARNRQGQFCIVWISTSVRDSQISCNISMADQESIVNDFGLYRARQLAASRGFICSPAENQRNSGKQHISLNTLRFDLLWRYDHSTSTTNAICWTDDDDDFLSVMDAPGALKTMAGLSKHPMFIALVMASCISQDVEREIGFNADRISSVENRTRHTSYIYEEDEVAEGSFSTLSAMMSGCATALAELERDCDIVRDVLEPLRQTRWPKGEDPPQWKQSLAEEVLECANVLEQRLKAHVSRIQYFERIANIQLTAVSRSRPTSNNGEILDRQKFIIIDPN